MGEKQSLTGRCPIRVLYLPVRQDELVLDECMAFKGLLEAPSMIV